MKKEPRLGVNLYFCRLILQRKWPKKYKTLTFGIAYCYLM